MNKFFYLQQPEWKARGKALDPVLNYETVLPIAEVECVADKDAWQGVAIRPVAEPEAAMADFFQFRTFRFDFGRHLVGHLELELEYTRCNDAPVRIVAKFAETPYELAADFDRCTAHLDHSWLQRETLTFDEAPEGTVRFPRRYAFRYLELKLGSPNYHTRLKALRAVAETSAGTLLPASGGLTEEEKAIDRVAAATLRDCMQSVFEDGPKRDRRLWLGDLWMQAKVNAFTYRNYQLAEHSLYLVCSAADEQGEIPSSLLLRKDEVFFANTVPTYSLLLGPMLYDHWQFYQRTEFCRELLPVALRQQEIFRAKIDADGVLHPPKSWWLFIDHDQQWLKPATAALGVYCFSLRETASLMRELGADGAEDLLAEADALGAKLRARLWDAELGLMRTDGQENDFSWATQAWLILGGVPTPEQAVGMWERAWSDPAVRKPRTPYLWSVVMEAGLRLGRINEVRDFIREYWGGMVKRGADTFWEVYMPDQPFFSSYGDALMNSACHAWSCIPGYLLRRSE